MSKLTTCKTCEKEVSVNAKTCPHCGEENPAKKEKKGSFTETILGLLILLGIVVLTIAFCSPDDDKAPKTRKTSPKSANVRASGAKIFSVSDFEYTMNDKDAVSIAFGASQTRYCDATIYRASVYKGYRVESIRRSARELSLTCAWNGVSYFRSSKHQTFSKLKIITLDKRAQKARLAISAKLVEPGSGKYLLLDHTTLDLKGEHFENFVKKM